jgi:hypothetical protein
VQKCAHEINACIILFFAIFSRLIVSATELFSPRNQNTVRLKDACANANADYTFEDIMTVLQQHPIPLSVYRRVLELVQWDGNHLRSQLLHLLEPAIEC